MKTNSVSTQKQGVIHSKVVISEEEVSKFFTKKEVIAFFKNDEYVVSGDFPSPRTPRQFFSIYFSLSYPVKRFWNNSTFTSADFHDVEKILNHASNLQHKSTISALKKMYPFMWPMYDCHSCKVEFQNLPVQHLFLSPNKKKTIHEGSRSKNENLSLKEQKKVKFQNPESKVFKNAQTSLKPKAKKEILVPHSVPLTREDIIIQSEEFWNRAQRTIRNARMDQKHVFVIRSREDCVEKITELYNQMKELDTRVLDYLEQKKNFPQSVVLNFLKELGQ